MQQVDIILPSYNSEKFIDECIESIRSQSFSNFNVLVIDNGSSDKSLESIRKWCKEDSRVELIANKENLGALGSIIKGFNISKAEYLMFLPADDRLGKEFLSLTVNGLKEHPNAAFAYTSSKMSAIDANTQVIGEKTRRVPHYESGEYCEPASLMLNYYTGIPLIRKSVYEKLGGFNSGFLQAADYDLYIRAAALHNSVYIDSLQQQSLKHENQLSKQYQKTGRAFWDSNKIFQSFFENENMPTPLRLFAKTIEFSKFTGSSIAAIAQDFLNSPEALYREFMNTYQDDYLYYCVEAILSQYSLRKNPNVAVGERYGSVAEAANISGYLLDRNSKKITELLRYHNLSLS